MDSTFNVSETLYLNPKVDTPLFATNANPLQLYHYPRAKILAFNLCANRDLKDKDKDLFIGAQEFAVGYSKAPEQQQSSARPICHSHAITRTGREPATTRITA